MTKNKAQERIRSHLDRRSNHSVALTERMTRFWWNLCNVALFENKLYPPSQILIKPIKDWGYCSSNSENEIDIAVSSEIKTRGAFLATLIHEMVHQWEQENYGRMRHGKRFFTRKDHIEKEIWLDIHTDIDDEDYNTYGQKQLYKRRHKGSNG